MSEHTWEIKPTQEEVESVRRKLEASGWVIYPERVPLTGQSGYYCVRTVKHDDGTSSQHTHSVRWNLFDAPLRPVTILCRDDADLLSFLWQHARYPGFGFFEYGENGDVGLVCYCHGSRGCSLVLRIGDGAIPGVTHRAIVVLRRLAD